jgi:hypothetical protein
MNKVERFEQFLQENNIPLQHGTSDNGNHVFATEQRLECGADVKVLITFDQTESTVSLYVLDFVKLPKKDNKVTLLEMINNLHKQMMFINYFVTDQDTVAMQYFFHIQNAFSPTDIVGQMALMLNTADQQYPQFMRTVWT